MRDTQVMDRPEHVLLRRMTSVIGQGEKMGTEETSNIILVDHSSSTSELIGKGDQRPKIVGIKEALIAFILKLPISCYLSIICFASSAKVLWGMQRIGDSKLQIIKLVQDLKPSGTTAMKGAVIHAEQEFLKAPEGSAKRLYELSDGMGTDGNPLENCMKLKKQDVQIHTIGFGEDISMDEALLRQMASVSSSGDPLYYHFTDAKRLTKYFKRESQVYSR